MTLIAIRCSEHFSVGLTTPNWWGEGVGYECMTIVSFVAGYLGLPAGCISSELRSCTEVWLSKVVLLCDCVIPIAITMIPEAASSCSIYPPITF
jgi:hypothetical protein